MPHCFARKYYSMNQEFSFGHLLAIPNSFHLMWHGVNTLFDEELNIAFNLLCYIILFFHSCVLVQLLPNATFAILFMVQICRSRDAHNRILNNLTNIHVMYSNKLLVEMRFKILVKYFTLL
jgi:hypothetical protein